MRRERIFPVLVVGACLTVALPFAWGAAIGEGPGVERPARRSRTVERSDKIAEILICHNPMPNSAPGHWRGLGASRTRRPLGRVLHALRLPSNADGSPGGQRFRSSRALFARYRKRGPETLSFHGFLPAPPRLKQGHHPSSGRAKAWRPAPSGDRQRARRFSSSSSRSPRSWPSPA